MLELEGIQGADVLSKYIMPFLSILQYCEFLFAKKC